MNPAPLPQQQPPEILGGLIPRNGPALVAYYCGIFSFIPCLGVILGPVAFIFGILGLKTEKREPFRKGGVHSWIGIICGGLFGLVNIAGVVVWLVAMVAAPHR